MVFDIKDITNIEVGAFISELRKNLLSKDFVEIRLKNLVDYTVTNTNSISINESCHLRYTPEPEIWELGRSFSKFFSVVNLFRYEDENSKYHLQEFSIIDTYERDGTEDSTISLLFSLLAELERELNLFSLSELPKKRITYEKFNREEYLDSRVIYIVTEYPTEESFFDTINHTTKKSTKSELFIVLKDNLKVEFGVLGMVGQNNSEKFKLVNKTVDFPFSKLSLFGGCLGIERLILIYKLLKDETY